MNVLFERLFSLQSGSDGVDGGSGSRRRKTSVGSNNLKHAEKRTGRARQDINDAAQKVDNAKKMERDASSTDHLGAQRKKVGVAYSVSALDLACRASHIVTSDVAA